MNFVYKQSLHVCYSSTIEYLDFEPLLSAVRYWYGKTRTGRKVQLNFCLTCKTLRGRLKLKKTRFRDLLYFYKLKILRLYFKTPRFQGSPKICLDPSFFKDYSISLIFDYFFCLPEQILHLFWTQTSWSCLFPLTEHKRFPEAIPWIHKQFRTFNH